MNKLVLYRKQLELLVLAKNTLLSCGNNPSNFVNKVRPAFSDLFYENNNNLKAEFVELIPVEDLASTRKLLDFLSVLSGTSGNGYFTGGYNSPLSLNDLLKRIDNLLKLMKEQISLHSCFTVFYSWQSDSCDKVNRNFIETCIKKALKELNNESDIKLVLDKDTRNTTGSPDIFPTILRKIDEAMVFIGDITPIYQNDNKAIPNPNVMCELGYALSSLSDERVILICNTDNCSDLKKLPFDLGLKRAMLYSLKEGSAEKSKIKNELTNSLKTAIRQIRDL